MQTNQTESEKTPANAGDNNLVPEAARPSEEIVPLQRMGRLLAEIFERRAAEWGRAGELPFGTGDAIALLCAQMAEDLRAEEGKQPNVQEEPRR